MKTIKLIKVDFKFFIFKFLFIKSLQLDIKSSRCFSSLLSPKIIKPFFEKKRLAIIQPKSAKIKPYHMALDVVYLIIYILV